MRNKVIGPGQHKSRINKHIQKMPADIRADIRYVDQTLPPYPDIFVLPSQNSGRESFDLVLPKPGEYEIIVEDPIKVIVRPTFSETTLFYRPSPRSRHYTLRLCSSERLVSRAQIR